jgi:hypothetical protein
VKNADSGPSNRQTLKCGDYPEVEDALYTWFLQVCKRHTLISGEIIREKAKYFYKMIMKKMISEQEMDGWINLTLCGPVA